MTTGDLGQKSIGEVAALVGVSVMTIRSWEQRYRWPRPARTNGAHRRYSPEDVERLLALAEMRRYMSTRLAIQRLRELYDGAGTEGRLGGTTD